ncbi:uncharacterized protein VP01_2597g2 [Puccinia sorghi]|uniref:RlpA-like protein double-psi beta-barrel domain-containing protein n=1 Tax=Puccinia sorghi TaxID=27349 RepID=A0A0L6V5B7_9BASI|nr:uncharacterized protein VP01_2597g2 [Puccinia sorghi]
MHSSRISTTLGCLLLQISNSAIYGHAAALQGTSLNSRSMARTALPTAMFPKQRRAGTASVANTTTASSDLHNHRKKCSGGIKSRYCRSYHRKVKEQQKLDSVRVTAASVPVTADTTPASVIEPEAPKHDAETHKPEVVTPQVEIKASNIKAVIPEVNLHLPKIQVPEIIHNAGAKVGDATYYGTGMGACGIVSNDNSMIAAASRLLFDSFPGATANPNLNPICGRKVRATYEGRSVEVEIVDRCEACAMHDLDFSPAAYDKLGAKELGRLHGMAWEWI